MQPATKKRIKSLKKRGWTEIELWKDTMCGQMPVPEQGKCITPDGVIVRGLFCEGCRYSNWGI